MWSYFMDFLVITYIKHLPENHPDRLSPLAGGGDQTGCLWPPAIAAGEAL